jgi:DNA primase
VEREAIKELLRELEGPNIALVDHPEWVGCCCVLAPWTHPNGRDSSPSCGISVKPDGGTSIYHCWSCGSKGTVPWLLRQLEKYTGKNHARIIRELERGEFLGGSLPEWGERTMTTVKLTQLDEKVFTDLYESALDHPYIQSRGITNATVEKTGMLIDPADSQGDERVLFPVYGRNRELYGFTGRAVYDSVEPRIRDYHGLPKKNVLLGLHLITPEDTTVIVVEGLFDYAKLVQYDVPVVATLHAGVTAGQKRLLLELGLPIVWMFDSDEPGKAATNAAVKAIGKHLPMYVVRYPTRLQPRSRKAITPKDPATCTRAEVYDMFTNAAIV